MQSEKNILFSIVVPVYNVEKYLTECLDSIIEQANELSELVEVILVDDGSTDSSSEICDDYAKRYSDFIRVYHKSNEGLLLTRRYGFKRVQGEYIINCDSDDVLERGVLQILKNTIEQYDKPDVILINYQLYENGIKTPKYENLFSNELTSTIDKQTVLIYYFKYNSVVSMCGKVCKRVCYEVDKDYSSYAWISNGEDSLQTLEIFDHATTYVYLNRALYNYRIGSGMTAKFDSKFLPSFMTVTDEIEKRRDNWNLVDFDNLIAIKILNSIGRAITQSRLNRWDRNRQWRDYLCSIYENKNFRKYSHSEYCNKNYLKRSYFDLIKMLRKKHFYIIIFCLKIKNMIGER